MSEKTDTALMVPEAALDLNAAIAMQQAYLDACKALLDDNDYAIIRGEKFRKRSGWAKLRRAFGVSCEIMQEERVVNGDDWGYQFVVRATLPTGRYEDADGACMASEFSGQRIPPTLPNVRAKALTRAKSRATSDVLGAGIVSAEEIVNSAKHWIDSDRVRKRFWRWVREDLALTDQDVYQALGVEHIHDYTGTMQDAKADIERWIDAQRKTNTD